MSSNRLQRADGDDNGSSGQVIGSNGWPIILYGPSFVNCLLLAIIEIK